MNESTVDERLSALEHAVAEIRGRLAGRTPAPNWLEQVIGSMAGVEGFEEVVAYGRQFRYADRPTDDSGPPT